MEINRRLITQAGNHHFYKIDHNHAISALWFRHYSFSCNLCRTFSLKLISPIRGSFLDRVSFMFPYFLHRPQSEPRSTHNQASALALPYKVSLSLFFLFSMCMAKVHLPPMNKFACKLHGYIVYLDHRLTATSQTGNFCFSKKNKNVERRDSYIRYLLQHASEAGSPKNRLGSGPRRDTGR